MHCIGWKALPLMGIQECNHPLLIYHCKSRPYIVSETNDLDSKVMFLGKRLTEYRDRQFLLKYFSSSVLSELDINYKKSWGSKDMSWTSDVCDSSLNVLMRNHLQAKFQVINIKDYENLKFRVKSRLLRYNLDLNFDWALFKLTIVLHR